MKKIKRVFKATMGMLLTMAALTATMAMWFSAKFLPVYIGGEFIIVNRIARYGLYALLIGIGIVGLEIFSKAYDELEREKRRRKRHQ